MTDDDAGGFVQAARQVLNARRALAEFLPARTFHDVAWDIVLEAFCAFHVGQKLCIKEYGCITGEPATTCSRRIDKLIKAGFLRRDQDTDDIRRTYMIITYDGNLAVQTMLKELLTKAP